ncbi:hypothetical protein Bca52824_036804 [Brassica carinata]|uniref:ADP-ribosylation factor n=1 Tax=Brassica carinata TaxID=52824 RepID=A0A8X7V334_BRACI|nr:hypothetical protein Bca52824_036804 [Brassica carinata]
MLYLLAKDAVELYDWDTSHAKGKEAQSRKMDQSMVKSRLGASWCRGTRLYIYVVDSLDRERLGKAKQEFQEIIKDPFMLNSIILVFANKQDMRGAMSPREVCEGLGLFDLKNRKWHIQGTCALRGDGLYEGLDWLSSTLKDVKAAGFTSVGHSF